MDPDEKRLPIYRVATVNEMPSRKQIAAAKRDINKGWRRFCEKRGIDPSIVGQEHGFKPRGRPRKSEASTGDEDGGDDLPSAADAAMD